MHVRGPTYSLRTSHASSLLYFLLRPIWSEFLILFLILPLLLPGTCSIFWRGTTQKWALGSLLYKRRPISKVKTKHQNIIPCTLATIQTPSLWLLLLVIASFLPTNSFSYILGETWLIQLQPDHSQTGTAQRQQLPWTATLQQAMLRRKSTMNMACR